MDKIRKSRDDLKSCIDNNEKMKHKTKQYRESRSNEKTEEDKTRHREEQKKLGRV